MKAQDGNEAANRRHKNCLCDHNPVFIKTLSVADFCSITKSIVKNKEAGEVTHGIEVQHSVNVLPYNFLKDHVILLAKIWQTKTKKKKKSQEFQREAHILLIKLWITIKFLVKVLNTLNQQKKEKSLKLETYILNKLVENQIKQFQLNFKLLHIKLPWIS